MKKGRFVNDFEEPPRLLGKSGATEKTPYAEAQHNAITLTQSYLCT